MCVGTLGGVRPKSESTLRRKLLEELLSSPVIPIVEITALGFSPEEVERAWIRMKKRKERQLFTFINSDAILGGVGLSD